MSIWVPKVDGPPNIIWADHINRLQNLKMDKDELPYTRPEDYGAVGDGVHDDTAAIQAANAIGGNIVFADKTYLVDDDLTISSGTTLVFVNGGKLSITAGHVVTINGHVAASLEQIFSGAGTVVFGAGSITEVYPQWFGANDTASGVIGDVDAGAYVNLAIDSMPGRCTLRMVGSFRVDTNILLKSDTNYDLTEATLYAGVLTYPEYVLHASGKSNINIDGGKFLGATYSDLEAHSTGDYVHATMIGITNGCDNIKMVGGHVSGYWGGANVYDSTHITVERCYVYRCAGGIQGVATTQDIADIKFINNSVIDSGDDCYSLMPGGTARNVYNCIISGNYADKTRFISPPVAAALGVRVGLYGVSGNVYGISVTNNTFRNMTDTAIGMHGTYNSIVTGNTINGFDALSNGAAAMVFGLSPSLPVSGCIISGNTIRNPISGPAKGIECPYIVNSQIFGNVIDVGGNGVAGYGVIMLYGGSSGNLIGGNQITTTIAGNYGIQILGDYPDSNVTSDNIIHVPAGTVPIAGVVPAEVPGLTPDDVPEFTNICLSGLGLGVIPYNLDPALSPEMVTNGGFDSDTTGWAADSCTIDSIGGGEDGNCLEITYVSGSYQSAYRAVPGLSVGISYELSGYVKSGTSGDGGFRILAILGGEVHSVSGTTSGAWTKYSVKFTASVASYDLYLFKINSASGTMLFDSISVRAAGSLADSPISTDGTTVAISGIQSFASDAAAGTGGIPAGGLYAITGTSPLQLAVKI